MTDDEIKVLESIRDGQCSNQWLTAEDKDALTAAIDYIRDTSEMLEAAVSVGFQSHFLTRISQETWVMHSDESSNGIQSDSALECWRETQEKKDE